MDYSCTPTSSLRLLTNAIIILSPYLITGQPSPLYGGPVSTTDNFTWTSGDYSNANSDLSSPNGLVNSKLMCHNKSDGMYRYLQSANSYYICKEGQYRLHQCNEGLVFNELSQNCERRTKETESNINPCDTQQNGLIPNYLTTHCQQYFRCERGVLIEQKYCNDGMRFSYADQSCLPSDQVTCTQTHCDRSADGYYVTPGSMCKAYYTCINGIKKDYICPSGLVFDKDIQTCTGSGGICYELICIGRVNGLYADTTHGCQRYYACEGGNVKSVQGCPPGYLFNGTICANNSLVYCSSAGNTAISLPLPITDICAGLQEGANSVSDEYCQAYVLCKSGMTIAELQCPIGQNFDGRKCINAELAPCSSFCAGKSNGYYANIRKHCQEYVKCKDGYIEAIQKCPEGTVFNGEICVQISSFSCPIFEYEQNVNKRKCLYLKDGFYTDYLSGCKEYFFCHKGILVAQNSCSENFVWNGRQCVSKYNFTCEGPQISPECSVRGNGFFTDTSKSSGCNKYYYCKDDKQVRLRCPDYHVFNGYNCVPSEFYKCPINDVDCHEKPEGYYTDVSSGCQSYYYCSNGNKITYLCPNDNIFNGNDCVLKHLYKCPGNHSNVCQNLSNGYYPDIENGCHTYFYCLNYRQIMTFTCPPREVFDGFKCVSSLTNICQNFTKIPCNILQDNVYIKPDTDCREYFLCSNKKLAYLSKCEEGHAFNGSSCIKFTPELCRTIMIKQADDQSECTKRNNGFFPNLVSGCRDYFYCIDGAKTSLSCPQGKIFNGELCVTEINFHCPINII